MMDNGGIISHNLDIKGLLEIAYAVTNSEGNGPQFFSRERIILPFDTSRSRYDLMFTLPNHPIENCNRQSAGRPALWPERKSDKQTSFC